MTISTKTTIKAFFETGDTPSQSNFSDFIDSCFFMADNTTQQVSAAVNFSGAVTIAGSALGNLATKNTSSVIIDNGSNALTIGPNQITEAMQSQMGANTVRVNATAVSASGTNLSVAASRLVGRASAGNVAAIAVSGSLSFSNDTLVGAKGLINIQYILASTTYVKTTGTNSQLVKLWGAGGGSGSGSPGTGGTSTFDVMSATGGGAASSSPATGGIGSGGDINMRGGGGTAGAASDFSVGGCAAGGGGGGGGGGSTGQVGGFPGGGASGSSNTASGAGAGYCEKYYSTAVNNIVVTIGSGGTAGTNGSLGANGACIVMEYS